MNDMKNTRKASPDEIDTIFAVAGAIAQFVAQLQKTGVDSNAVLTGLALYEAFVCLENNLDIDEFGTAHDHTLRHNYEALRREQVEAGAQASQEASLTLPQGFKF